MEGSSAGRNVLRLLTFDLRTKNDWKRIIRLQLERHCTEFAWSVFIDNVEDDDGDTDRSDATGIVGNFLFPAYEQGGNFDYDDDDDDDDQDDGSSVRLIAGNAVVENDTMDCVLQRHVYERECDDATSSQSDTETNIVARSAHKPRKSPPLRSISGGAAEIIVALEKLGINVAKFSDGGE